MSFARRLQAALFFSLLVCRSTSANADEGATPPPRTTWYGYQTLIADGASLALVLGGGTLPSSPELRSTFAFAGVGSYLFAPFVIHAAHGHVARGAGSLALRGLAPLAGALVGLVVTGIYLGVSPAPDNPDDAAATFLRTSMVAAIAMQIGVGAGVISAVTIDSAVLAREESKQPAPSQAFRSSPMKIHPVIAPTGNGATAGIGGIF